MQLILYAHFRNREAVAASQNGLPVAGKCTKNPAYLHRPCQNPEAPARHPLIDMRAELYAFARQGVRIASGVDSRIEIGMDFIRRHVQQGDYPISGVSLTKVSRQSSALLRISTKEPPRSPEARAGASCRKAISRR